MGALYEAVGDLLAVSPGYEHLYDEVRYGLGTGDDPSADPSSLIV